MHLLNLKYPGILIGVLLILLGSSLTPASAVETQEKNAAHPWSVSLKAKYFFHSHTSYEFGNPFPPYQTPLSRLEFPLNSWWAGASLRREFSRFSAGVEVFRNLSGEVSGKMMDSDWDDEERPALKTIYSESSCRMEPSYIVSADMDLRVSDWLGLPRWLDLRPAAGLTWQRFSLVTHDGIQYNLTPEGIQTTLLPGDGIAFKQNYWQFFVGFRAAFDLGKPFHLSGLKIETQVDWAYVAARNEDRHLLRIGNRITEEDTPGDAWHALVNLKIGLAQNLNANIGAEYRRIATTGSHRLINETFGFDFKFYHGVKVWSEQTSITMGLEYAF